MDVAEGSIEVEGKGGGKGREGREVELEGDIG